MDSEDFKSLNSFKRYIINLLKSHKFAGMNMIGLTPNGQLIALGVNMPQSMADVKLGFKALYNQLMSQMSEYPSSIYPSKQHMNKVKEFHFEDDNEEDKDQMAKDINNLLDNSPKTYPQISDPEDCGPRHITHEDPLKQAEEIIKNSKKFR